MTGAESGLGPKWWSSTGPFIPPLPPALRTISAWTVSICITTLSDLGLFLTLGLGREFSVSRVMVWVPLRLPCEPCPWLLVRGPGVAG